jgi:3-dehydroquinate synthase
MLAEARISNKLGMLDKNELIRLKNVIAGAGLPTELPNLQLEKVMQAMKHDKKIIQGKLRFVLPDSIGKVFITEEVSSSLVEQVLVDGNGET